VVPALRPQLLAMQALAHMDEAVVTRFCAQQRHRHADAPQIEP